LEIKEDEKSGKGQRRIRKHKSEGKRGWTIDGEEHGIKGEPMRLCYRQLPGKLAPDRKKKCQQGGFNVVVLLGTGGAGQRAKAGKDTIRKS